MGSPLFRFSNPGHNYH